MKFRILVVHLLFLCFSLSAESVDKKVHILCFGDSITQGTYIDGKYVTGNSWVNMLNERSGHTLHCINEGRSGRKASDTKELPPILKKHKHVDEAIIFLGVNDLNVSTEDVLESCRTNSEWIINKMREAYGKELKITLLSSPGLAVSRMAKRFYKKGYDENEDLMLYRLREVYRDLAEKMKCQFVDLWREVSPQNFNDGLHPDLKGQAQITEKIWTSRVNQGRPFRVACVGDSITFGASIKRRKKNHYPAQLQNMLGRGYQVENYGVSGRTLLKKGDRPYWQEERYQQALAFQPNAVVIKLGTNDVKPHNWKHKKEFKKNLRELGESFLKLETRPKVYLSLPVPVEKDTWNITEATLKNELIPLIKELAAETKWPLIDFYSAVPAGQKFFTDGVHPNAQGARRIAQTAYHKLKDRPFKTSAVVPVPKLEPDGYNWYKRHGAVIDAVKKEKPDLVFIGDSITHFMGGVPQSKILRGGELWQKFHGKRKAVNMGFGWDRTQNVLYRIHSGAFADIDPRLIVVLIGTNNLTATRNAPANTPGEIALGITTICEALHKKCANAHILLMGVLPRGEKPNHPFRKAIAEINEQIAHLAQHEHISFLDIGDKFLEKNGAISRRLMPDALHPNVDGYQIWLNAIEKQVKKYLEEK